MNESSNQRLSIVMPFFNNKELVGEMIDSIIANSFQNWELWAIDDGSTDGTFEYLTDKYTADQRINIMKRDRLPKGAQTCRNIGIEKMSGEYVVFFDSDDYITPECLQTRVDAISKEPDIDFMVFPSGTFVDNKFIPNAPNYKFGYPVHKNDIKSFMCRELPFIVWNNIYKTKSIRSYGMRWDEKLLSLQDADFNISAIFKGMRYKYAQVKPDYGYRISVVPNSISRKITSKEHFASHIYATERMFCGAQSIFGHKYDRCAYKGLLSIYNRIFTNGIDKTYAKKTAECAYKYSKFYGIIMKAQVTLTILLEKIVSPKRARQIPMAFYLFSHYYRELKTQKRIHPIS